MSPMSVLPEFDCTSCPLRKDETNPLSYVSATCVHWLRGAMAPLESQVQIEPWFANAQPMVPSAKRASSYSPSLFTIIPPYWGCCPEPVGKIQAEIESWFVNRSESDEPAET